MQQITITTKAEAGQCLVQDSTCNSLAISVSISLTAACLPACLPACHHLCRHQGQAQLHTH